MIKTVVWGIAAALAAALTLGAAAHEVRHSGIEIEHPWVRETPKGTEIAAGFAKIRNVSKEADRLMSASIRGASSGEIHEMKLDGDVMRMREVPGGILLAPGEAVELKSGGMHIMFRGLTKGLEAGEYIDGWMKFEKAGKIDVEFYVEPLAPGPASGGGHAHPP